MKQPMQRSAASRRQLLGALTSVVGLSCAGPAAGATSGPALTPGAEASVPLLAGTHMLVFLPSNYRPEVKWPVIFFYHGQNGSPTTSWIRQHTDERDYIVVGLPYLTPEGDQPEPEFANRELPNLRAARQWLAGHASTDETRVYLGGVSKGGWAASRLGEPELPRLAGLIMVLAGRSYPCATAPGGAAYRGKPLYVGDGETDNNMRPARQAVMFFQRQGAQVTFEEYLGLGHAMPPEAPRLRTWLLAQHRYATRTTAAQAELGPWFTNAVAAARAAGEVSEKFRLALELARDPRLYYCGPPAGAAVQSLLQEAAARSPAREEWNAETTYWNLLWKVATLRTPDELRATRDGFQQLNATCPNTRWGRLAAADYRALADAYDRTLAARSNPTNSTSRSGVNARGIPVPRWSGNKIIFDR